MRLFNMIFLRWTRKDCINNDSTDHCLLLLGNLRYIKRVLIFNDIKEFTFVSSTVHRVFFKQFLEYESTFLCQKYMTEPVI